MLAMPEIISYIISFVSTVLGLLEPFWKKMQTILIFNFTGNLLVGISYFLVSSYSGAAICAVACIQVFVNYIFDVKKKKIPLWLVAIYALAFLGVNLLSFKAWYDIFSLIAAMLFVISVAQENSKYYRIFYFLNSTVWIFYDFLAGAYGNLFTHIVLFAATLIAILVRDRKKAKSE
jgi:hypothetical protein